MKSAVKAGLAIAARRLSDPAPLARAADVEAVEALRAHAMREQRRLVIEEARPQVELARELAELQARVGAETPDSPSTHGFKIYSQADEDGIIKDILGRLEVIAPLSRTFIEIGCGDERESNTHDLAMKGFRGCWCDGSDKNIDYIDRELEGVSFPRLRVTRQRHPDSGGSLDSLSLRRIQREVPAAAIAVDDLQSGTRMGDRRLPRRDTPGMGSGVTRLHARGVQPERGKCILRPA